ncbi:MAG: hypothetical protein KIT17_26650, partial [Rubrivivax sp.]|nr:hypothetical protein [Rubrivivax sp.]
GLHRFAATLGLGVVLPRLLLALRAAWSVRARAQRLAWSPADAYVASVLAQRRHGAGGGAAAGGGRVVQVLPHGFTPAPAATLALRSLLAAALGPRADLHVAPATPYGEEDRPVPPPPAGAGWRVAWFDAAATPEPQAQGRFVETLRAASTLPLALLVDEGGFRQRMAGFGDGAPRLAQRRAAWRQFAETCGGTLALVDLGAAAADLETAADRLRAVLGRPAVPSPR